MNRIRLHVKSTSHVYSYEQFGCSCYHECLIALSVAAAAVVVVVVMWNLMMDTSS